MVKGREGGVDLEEFDRAAEALGFGLDLDLDLDSDLYSDLYSDPDPDPSLEMGEAEGERRPRKEASRSDAAIDPGG